MGYFFQLTGAKDLTIARHHKIVGDAGITVTGMRLRDSFEARIGIGPGVADDKVVQAAVDRLFAQTPGLEKK